MDVLPDAGGVLANGRKRQRTEAEEQTGHNPQPAYLTRCRRETPMEHVDLDIFIMLRFEGQSAVGRHLRLSGIPRKKRFPHSSRSIITSSS